MISPLEQNKNLIFNLYLNKYRTHRRKAYSLNHPSFSVCSARTSSGIKQQFDLSTSLVLKENQQQPIEIKYISQVLPQKPINYHSCLERKKVSFKKKDGSLSLALNKSLAKIDKINCASDLKKKIIVHRRQKTYQGKQIQTAPAQSKRVKVSTERKKQKISISSIRKKVKTQKSTFMGVTSPQLQIKPWNVVDPDDI